MPYVEPTTGFRIFVAGTFYAMGGQSDRLGTETRVWAPRIYHFGDGSTQLGAPGTRAIGATDCEWAVALRME